MDWILKKANADTEREHLNKILKEVRSTITDLPITSPSFESVSKNLKASDATFNYSIGKLSTIVYSTDLGTVTKTFNYTGDKLTSIVLSGATPGGIELTKTLGYTVDTLTSVTYT